MPAWLGITLAVAAPIFSFVGTLLAVSFMMGGRLSKLETVQHQHTDALKTLPEVLKDFVTKEEGKGYQAQIDRLERSDAECDGRMSQMRSDFEIRSERIGTRMTAHEQATSAQNTAVTNALAEFRATIAALKESVDRLEAVERTRAPQHQSPDLMSMLNLAVQAAPLVRQLITRPA